MSARHVAAVAGSAFLVFGLALAAIIFGLRLTPLTETSILGAVLVDDTDPPKQMPIPNAHVVATLGRVKADAVSDSNGFFRVTFPAAFRLNHPMLLNIQANGFEPISRVESESRALVIARLRPMKPLTVSNTAPGQTIANVRIRYTVRSESFIDVGAVVKTFSAVNVGNQPCHLAAFCSPNGDWKAGRGHIVLDAGIGNHFRSPRVSCIAGPCPFTRIETETLHQDDRMFEAAALAWSDTATFLVEADVVHTQAADLVRQAFPVVFGRGLSFTLPPTAAGPIIQAELDGQDIFFPLGPALNLSWATCTATANADRATLYACELKRGYRFP